MNFMNFSAQIQGAFKNDEKNYMAFKQLVVDLYKDNLNGVSKYDAEQKIQEIFRNAIGVSEKASKKEVRKAIRRNQVQVYELMEDLIEEILVTGWEQNPFYREFVDVKNIALGDANEFYVEDNSILSVMKVSGNHHDIIRQRLGAGRVFSVETSWIAVKVYQEFERVATGIESASKFTAKISEAIDQYVNQAIYDALVAAGNNLGSAWKKSGAISSATAVSLRNLCMDVSYASGKEVVIMGTRAALANVFGLTNVDWASNDMKNEMYTTGKFGYWEGIKLVEIKQSIKAIDDNAAAQTYMVANNILFVMPVDAEPMIKLVYEGDTQMYAVQDAGVNMDMTYTQEVQTKLGVGVVTNQKFGMWTITA